MFPQQDTCFLDKTHVWREKKQPVTQKPAQWIQQILIAHTRVRTVKVKHLVIVAVIDKHGAVHAAGEGVEERDVVRAAQLVETHQHRQVGRLAHEGGRGIWQGMRWDETGIGAWAMQRRGVHGGDRGREKSERREM